MTSIQAAQTGQIEQIVRDVLRRIGDGQTPRIPASDRPTPQPSRLRITDQVVSMESLRNVLTDASALVLNPGAIVTPSVRDETGRRGITLEYASEPTSCTSAKPRTLTCVTCDACPRIAKVMDQLSQLARAMTCLTNPDVNALLYELQMKATGASSHVIWLTESPAIAVHQASRVAWLRAAWVIDLPSVAEARQSLDANVYVLQPSRHGIQDMHQLIHTIQEQE